jgi:hypothetical protein
VGRALAVASWGFADRFKEMASGVASGAQIRDRPARYAGLGSFAGCITGSQHTAIKGLTKEAFEATIAVTLLPANLINCD